MNRAALVCDHVAIAGDPILHAARSEPIEPADSGWQFLCGRGGHVQDAKIWILQEVLTCEPTYRSSLSGYNDDIEGGTDGLHGRIQF
jgi:hypothetical protein